MTSVHESPSLQRWQSHWKLTKLRQSSYRRHRLVEEAKAHVIILLLTLLLWWRGGSSCSSRGSSSGSWSSCGKGTGVSQESLDGLSLLEGDLSGRSNGQQVLHAVNDAVRHRCHVGIVYGQGHSSNVSHPRGELGKQVGIGDVQDLRVKHTAAVVHLGDDQTVAEGADLKHVQEGSLGHADPVASLDDVHVLDDLNGTLGNLSWDIASSSEVEWSYHWVMWHDVDDDGLLDCMAARFNVDFFGNTKSEFVWMKNPGNLKPDGTGWTGWEQHVLIENGPDVHVTMHTLEDQGQNYSVIITGELWTNRVMLYYVWDKPGAWSDPANIQSVVIEPDCGTIFEANAYDINADGKLEILASCTDGQDGKEGNFYLYTLPDNWRSPENWERKLLAGNFKPFQSTFNPKTMSPGKFKIFYPSLDYESQTNEDGSRLKPWISLSGDDDGKHYLLYPQSEDKEDWNYDIETIIDTGADTSGTMAIMDLDGDGYQELISAGYSADKVYVHTFSPNP